MIRIRLGAFVRAARCLRISCSDLTFIILNLHRLWTASAHLGTVSTPLAKGLVGVLVVRRAGGKPTPMRVALAAHDEVLRTAAEAHRGWMC